jgi:hypothetical protein
MAFSVLGSVIKGTVLEEKRCVEKTWPNWWDDLENKVRISYSVPYSHVVTKSFRSGSLLRVSTFMLK